MAPSGAAYHTDWIVSLNSNVHVAIHRGWLITYTPFDSQVTSHGITSGKTQVLGFGDVVLDVKISATRKGSKSHRKVILSNILHVPTYICNILGHPIFSQFEVNLSYGPDSKSSLKDKTTGACMGLIENLTLHKLWLAGQAKGRSSLDPDALYMINASLPSSELARWKSLTAHASKAKATSVDASKADVNPRAEEDDTPPYTAAEKAWLKQHYCDEFHFLQRQTSASTRKTNGN